MFEVKPQWAAVYWRLAMLKCRPNHSLLSATLAIGMSVLAPAALAQSGPTQAVAADDLFTGPESVDFKAGVGFGVNRLVNIVKQTQQAQPPGSQCPVDVDFTVMGGPHPQGLLYIQALAMARQDAITSVLQGFGPSVLINANTTTGLVSIVFLSAQTAKDKEPPKLHTTSVPPKGTKVKPGDQIKVTMVARDDANRWQTGIKTIQLVAKSEGGRFIASENFVRAPPGCTALPLERRAVATYTVPSNPPPIVRLAALAEDHVGLMDTDVGEFPTEGDWYGTIKASVKGNVYNDTADIDYAVSQAPDGTITGRGHVVVTSEPIRSIHCTYTRKITPSEFDVEITGSREGDNLRLDLSQVGRSVWVYTQVCAPAGGPSGTGPPGTVPYNALASIFANPRIRVLARDGESTPLPRWTQAELTKEGTVTIHKAKERQ